MILGQHSKFEVAVAAIVLSLVAHPLLADKTVRDALQHSKQCSKYLRDRTMCEYKLGQDLHVVIKGVGLPDASIVFRKSSFEGNYYTAYNLFSGCVVIYRGRLGNPADTGKPETALVAPVAYLSPRTGDVYDNIRDCENAQWFKSDTEQ